MHIKQGDEYKLKVKLKLDGVRIDTSDGISEIEFMVGDICKKYYVGIGSDAEGGSDTPGGLIDYWLIPLTQHETFALKSQDDIVLDVRVKFNDGRVIGLKNPPKIDVIPAKSRRVL